MSLFEKYSDVVSIQEMMKMLSIGKNKAYYLVNEGIIRSFRIGFHIRICKNSIIDYIQSQQSKKICVFSNGGVEYGFETPEKDTR